MSDQQLPEGPVPDCQVTELLTVTEAAAFSKVSTRTIWQWLADGRIQRRGPGDRVRIAKEDLVQVRAVGQSGSDSSQPLEDSEGEGESDG